MILMFVYFSCLSQENQFILTVYIAQKLAERVIIITMSGFNFVLALDYLLALIETSSKAFTFSEDNLEVKSNEKITTELKNIVSSKSVKQDFVNVIEFDLKQAEVFILESIEVPDAPACIFTCYSNIKLRLEQDVIMITGQISKISMFLANYSQFINLKQVEAYEILSPTELIINGSIKGLQFKVYLLYLIIYCFFRQ